MVSTVAVNVTRRVRPSTSVLNSVMDFYPACFENAFTNGEVIGVWLLLTQNGLNPWCSFCGIEEPLTVPEQEARFNGLRDSLWELTSRIITLTEGVIPIVIFSTVSHIILRVVLYCCHQTQRHHACAYQRLSHPPAAGGRQEEF